MLKVMPTNYLQAKQKHTAPRIPAWSPTAVLTWRLEA